MPHRASLLQLKTFMAQQIFGQETLIERMLICLLAGGHLLVEGAPGLAKTKAIKTLSEAIEADFHRIQFTPRSEEHTSELQSRPHLVCRLLLEKKKNLMYIA